MDIKRYKEMLGALFLVVVLNVTPTSASAQQNYFPFGPPPRSPDHMSIRPPWSDPKLGGIVNPIAVAHTEAISEFDKAYVELRDHIEASLRTGRGLNSEETQSLFFAMMGPRDRMRDLIIELDVQLLQRERPLSESDARRIAELRLRLRQTVDSQSERFNRLFDTVLQRP